MGHKNTIIMSVVWDTLEGIGKFLLLILSVWLAVWAANIFNYLLSIPFSVLGILFETASPWHVEFIYTFITTGLAYAFTFWYAASYFFNRNFIDNHPIIGRMLIVLVIMLVVSIYDVRIHGYMPEFISTSLDFLNTKCGFRILATVDWSNIDFSGSNVSSMQYNVFDTAIPVGGVALMIFGGHND